MKVTAAICTRNRPELLARCLPSILACTYRPREILIVDQSDDDRTRDLVASARADTDDGLVYVRTETRGLSAARNVATARATGSVIAFTDDDCVADPGWLGALAEEFRAETRLAAVCGRALPLLESPLLADPASVREDQARRLFRRPVSPWRIGNGCNMAFKVEALRKVGPFDERLGPGAPLRGGEEADLLYRLLKRGAPILYSPRPLIYHRQWRDATQQRALAYTYGVGVGAFCGKYLRRGDLRALRMLGGWTVATLKDVVRRVLARQPGRADVALRTLLGLGVGAATMLVSRSRGCGR
jgi:glycosyltransferase involved in cell wall biosynthesis